MSFAAHRYVEAYNKYMANFDHTKKSSYLMYFDVNSLYSWAMCNPLPIGGFKWVDVKDKNGYMKTKAYNKEYNFIVECDIEYPDNLHDLHNDYPLAPEKIIIDDFVKMSPYRENLIKKFNEKYDVKIRKSKVPKLISSFLPKKNYV